MERRGIEALSFLRQIARVLARSGLPSSSSSSCSSPSFRSEEGASRKMFLVSFLSSASRDLGTVPFESWPVDAA